MTAWKNERKEIQKNKQKNDRYGVYDAENRSKIKV